MSSQEIKNVNSIQFLNTETAPALEVGEYGLAINNGKVKLTDSTGFINVLSSQKVVEGKNFILNPDASAGLQGIDRYQDAASTAPVDGTGGTSTLGLTFETSVPLDSDASFNLVKGASNLQGQGWSIPFKVPLAKKAKVLDISFDYLLGSGTFLAGTQSALSDVVIYIYDVTNGTLIQPSSFKLFSNSTSIADKFIASFQTSATGSDYRLIFHVASTATTAFTLKVTNITVAPSRYVFGSTITDWVSYTPSWLAATTNPSLGNGTLIGRKRQVGDSMQYLIQLVAGSTTNFGSGQWSFSLGAGEFIDNSKLPFGLNVNVGEAFATDTGVTVYRASVLSVTNNTVTVNGGSGTGYSSTLPFTWGSGDTINLQFSVPIVGKTSSTQMSDDSSQRVILSSSYKASTAAASGTTTKITNFNSVNDPSGSFNITTGEFVVPVSGQYLVNYIQGITAYSTAPGVFVQALVMIYVNGTEFNRTAFSTANVISAGSISKIYSLRAGDVISFYANPGTGNANGLGISNVEIMRVSNPATLSATETVSCRYSTNSGQSIPNNTMTKLLYSYKHYDTHNAYNSSTGVYTVPISGSYRINIQALLNAVSWGAGKSVSVSIFSNGSFVSSIIYHRIEAATPTMLMSPGTGSTEYKFFAGDQITFEIIQDQGGSVSIYNDDRYNWMTISKVGF